MEQIKENANIVVILLEQLINKESNIEINRSLNDLRIYHVAILELIIYECNCHKALTLMEKIKERRTERLNNYLINTEEGKKILHCIMKLKLLSLFINCSNNITTILAFSLICSIYIIYKNNVKNK